MQGFARLAMTEMLQDLVAFVGERPNLALLVVFLISAGEALIIVGLFVPSTVVLVGAGTLVGMGKLPFIPIFVATTLGAIAGDAISYWIGHVWKDQLRELWPLNRYRSLLDQGETFFKKHGGKSILFGRFIPGVKAVVPGIAGMVGMDPVRFTIVNAISAVMWAAVHVLPAVAVGRGIDVAQSSNPRLLVLFLIIALFVVLIWYGAKMAIGILMPVAEHWQARLVRFLSSHPTPVSRWAARLLASENGVLAPFTYAAMALAALSGFVMLVVNLLFDPDLVPSDAAISAYLQTLRTEVVDWAMIAITMLGDSILLAAISLALIVSFLALRRWRLASSVAVAFIAASLFVPVMTTILHGARPTTLDDGVQVFSFPSGHATLSTTIFGISVLLLVHPLPFAYRRIAYLTTAVIIALIALSRVYLLAHWPSDVLAGLLFGGSLVFAMAFLLHGRPLRLPSGRLAAIIGIIFLTVYPTRLYYGYGDATKQYIAPSPPIALDRQEWLEGDWERLPASRILLDGDPGEPILIQADLPLSDVLTSLGSLGWEQQESSRLDQLLNSILPSKGTLSTHLARPLTNSGKSPLATFMRLDETASERRIVLRIWEANFITKQKDDANPILLMSATAEALNPIIFDFSLVEAARLRQADRRKIASDVVDVLPGRSLLKASSQPMHLVTSQ